MYRRRSERVDQTPGSSEAEGPSDDFWCRALERLFLFHALNGLRTKGLLYASVFIVHSITSQTFRFSSSFFFRPLQEDAEKIETALNAAAAAECYITA